MMLQTSVPLSRTKRPTSNMCRSKSKSVGYQKLENQGKYFQQAVLLEHRLGRAAVLKPDGVANFLAQHDIHLVRDPLGHAHGSDPPGLGAGHRSLRPRDRTHHVDAPLRDLETGQWRQSQITQQSDFYISTSRKAERFWKSYLSTFTPTACYCLELSNWGSLLREAVKSITCTLLSSRFGWVGEM